MVVRRHIDHISPHRLSLRPQLVGYWVNRRPLRNATGSTAVNQLQGSSTCSSFIVLDPSLAIA